MVQHILRSGLLSGTDADDTSFILNPGPHTVRLKAAYIVPEVAVTAHNDNHITVDLLKGSTSLVTAIHTDANANPAGASWVAGTALPFTITGGGTDIEVAAGSCFKVTVTDAGTGPAYTFHVDLRVEEVR